MEKLSTLYKTAHKIFFTIIQNLYLEVITFETEGGWDEVWVYEGEGLLVVYFFLKVFLK